MLIIVCNTILEIHYLYVASVGRIPMGTGKIGPDSPPAAALLEVPCVFESSLGSGNGGRSWLSLSLN